MLRSLSTWSDLYSEDPTRLRIDRKPRSRILRVVLRHFGSTTPTQRPAGPASDDEKKLQRDCGITSRPMRLPSSSVSPPDFASVPLETIAVLAQRLRAFDEAMMARAEATAPRMLDPVRLPVVHAWLRAEPGPGPVLARLFGYADRVPRARAVEVLGADVVDALVRAGMLAIADGDASSSIRIVPFGAQHIASDPMEAAADPVMGPGATTLELSRAMPVDAGVRVLDVGSGAGTLALAAAAAGAREVVGVDLHPRAAAV